MGCGGGGTTAPALIAPTLTAAAPSQGPTAGGTALTLTGANFSAGATVTVGGIPASAVQVVDDTTITCNTPPGTAGAIVDVTVTTAGGTATLAAAFTYLYPAPALTAVTPTIGEAGGGTTITLTGTGLDAGGVSVTVGGFPASGVNVMNDTTIRCVTPPGNPGLAAVAVTTAGGMATLPAAFTYLDLFFGTYHYAGYWGDVTVPAATSEWGTLEADGMGMVPLGSVMQITDGNVAGPFALPQLPYALDSARRITWDLNAAPFSHGGISADGSVLGLGTIGSGANPSLVFLVRREGSFSTGSLNGTYHLGVFFLNNPDDGAMWGTASFDGAGGVFSEVFNNVNGTIGGPFSGTEAYSVAANGTVTYTLGGQTIQGGLLKGGDLAILSGSTDSGGVSQIAVLIRQSTSASTATLSGSYHTALLLDNAGGTAGGWTSITGTGTANGAGTMTNNGGTVNTDGTITSEAGGGTLTYAIAANGTLTTTAGVDAAQGGVTSNGRYAFWTGATSSGDGPQFWFLWR